MKHFLFLICTLILFKVSAVYSQNIGYWEPTAKMSSNNVYVYRLSVADNGDIWAITLKGVFYSTNNGGTWIQTTNNGLEVTGNAPVVIPNQLSGSIFCSIMDDNEDGKVKGGIFRLSSKDGKFWEKVLDLSQVVNCYNINVFDITDMVVTASGDIYAVGFGTNNCTIYYSSDNGDTWMEKKGIPRYISDNNGHRNRPFPGFHSLTLASDGTLYATGWDGIYRLGNGVDTCVKILDGMVGQIAVSADGSIFVAAYDAGVLKSTDKGVTWKKTNKESYFVDRIINDTKTFVEMYPNYHFNNDCVFNHIIYNPVTNHLFASGLNKVSVSTDLGESWSDITSNLPTGEFNDITSFAVNPKTGMVFVSYAFSTIIGTIDRVYRLKVTSKEDIEFYMSKEKRPTLVLENYPNPFNPMTNIQYHLGENSLVTLKVYDIMGREIATLINNKMQLKGSYSSTFDGSGLSSGIYFYTLFANGKPYTQKMLLTK